MRVLGARRVWSDSRGALWITGWNSGDLFRYDSKANSWARWHLPGDAPHPYAVYVDENDTVWVSDWGTNAILRFDPKAEKFESFPLPDSFIDTGQSIPQCKQPLTAQSRCVQLLLRSDGDLALIDCGRPLAAERDPVIADDVDAHEWVLLMDPAAGAAGGPHSRS